MNEQLVEIGQRLSDLRKILDYDTKTFAERLNVTEEYLIAHEEGKRDFSFSFLNNAAQALGVDVVDLIAGESPRLSTAALVRAGEGLSVSRIAAYDYKHLAYTFRGKLAEPFLVTVEPRAGAPTAHSHAGQEFNYVLCGRLEIYIDNMAYDLGPGDSLYFNSAIPHALRALEGETVQFLAVVIPKTGDGAR